MTDMDALQAELASAKESGNAQRYRDVAMLVDALTPKPEPEPEKAPEPADATPAAVAHADETGVTLADVEGTGADGRITKADVAAVADATEPEKDEPSE